MKTLNGPKWNFCVFVNVVVFFYLLHVEKQITHSTEDIFEK